MPRRLDLRMPVTHSRTSGVSRKGIRVNFDITVYISPLLF